VPTSVPAHPTRFERVTSTSEGGAISS